MSSEVHYAGAILAGLRTVCVEAAKENGSPYLTEGELYQIDRVLAAIGYEDTYGASLEWAGSIRACLFHPHHPHMKAPYPHE